MTKRKRPARPDPDESTDDAAAKADMVHVTPDLLAGSPDIFAGKKVEPGVDAPAGGGAAAEAPDAAVMPADTATTYSGPEPVDVASPAEPEIPVFQAPVAEPVGAPPAYVTSQPASPRRRRGGSSMAIGIVFVVIGIFALAVVMTGVDLTESGWPLFIIIPGLALIVAGFLSLGSVATVPGGMVTMLGLVLAYASYSGHWAIWAYAWSLVAPFGVGLGVYLQALRERDRHSLQTGRTLLFVGFMIFLIGFVLFESILGISGRDAFGPLSKAALPLLLILVGAILLLRSMQRGRQA